MKQAVPLSSEWCPPLYNESRHQRGSGMPMQPILYCSPRWRRQIAHLVQDLTSEKFTDPGRRQGQVKQHVKEYIL